MNVSLQTVIEYLNEIPLPLQNGSDMVRFMSVMGAMHKRLKGLEAGETQDGAPLHRQGYLRIAYAEVAA